MNLFDRLEFLANGRRVYPWLMSLGLSSATIARMKKGKLPHVDQLMPIVRTENCSLNWLVEGIGMPYLIPGFPDVEEAIEHLKALDEEAWTLRHILTANGIAQMVVVFEQPGEFENGDAVVRYKIRDMASVPMDRDVLDYLLSTGGDSLRYAEVAPARMRRISRGIEPIGSLIDDVKPIETDCVREPMAEYIANVPDAKSEQIAMRVNRLERDQKNRLLGFLEALEMQKTTSHS